MNHSTLFSFSITVSAVAFGLLLSGVPLPAAAASATANSWPQFRGPTGQGHSASTVLPVHWSQSSNVKWSVDVPGSGWSSPIVHRDLVCVTTAVQDESAKSLSLRALAWHRDSGRLAWEREIFAPAGTLAKHKKNSHASPTPVGEQDRIFIHFGHFGTACLDLNGNVLWRQTQLEYPPVHGNGGSPALAGDKLIFNCDGGAEPFIAALDKETGSVAWKVPRQTTAAKTFSFCTPLLIDDARGPLVISPGSGVVSALNPRDGSEVWRVRYGDGYSVVPRPVLAHGLLFIGTGFDRPSVLAIRTGGAGDITDSHVEWSTARGAPNTPSMIVVGEELFFVSDAGVASCVDARTGQLHWNERLAGNFSASPLHANGLIYFTNERGRTFVVRAAKAFEISAENDLAEPMLASLGADDTSLFARTESRLYRLQAATRAESPRAQAAPAQSAARATRSIP